MPWLAAFATFGTSHAARAQTGPEPVVAALAETLGADAWTVPSAFGWAALGLVFLFFGLFWRTRQKSAICMQEARALSHRLSAVLDASNTALVGLSSSGRVVFANAEAQHIFATEKMEMSKDWFTHVEFLDAQTFQPLDQKRSPITRALSGETIKNELALMLRRGRRDPRFVEVSSAFVAETGSDGVSTVLSLNDVTEQERARQRTERSTRLDALGQLTGGIAHDFNNLLTAIKYSVQLSDASSDLEKQQEYNGLALKAVMRGAELTERLLAFAKRKPGVARSRRVDGIFADFEALVRATVEKDIAFEFDVTERDLLVFADAGQLESALLNLVLNARDAIVRSGQGNCISVTARPAETVDVDAHLRGEPSDMYVAQSVVAERQTEKRRGDGKTYRYVEFTVSDNGPGMSVETKRSAIEPFFTTKGARSGSGLGLSVVYGFIQQASGMMRISSELGQGTTVHLFLPRGSHAGTREAPVERLPYPIGHGQTILVVEDETDLLGLMGDVVRSLGYTALSASSGVKALEIVKSGAAIDAVLTDIVMPGELGGLGLERALRDFRPDLPVVFLTGYAGAAQFEVGDARAPVVQKPCAPGALAEALEKVLPSGAAAKTETRRTVKEH